MRAVSVVVGMDAELYESSVDDVRQTEDVIVSQWRDVSANEKHQIREQVDANWQQSDKVEHGCTTTNLPLSNGIKIVSVLQRLHGKIGRTISDVQKLSLIHISEPTRPY